MMERYSRQMLFTPIGEDGQQKISEKHMLIIGGGALGSANAENLTRAGIGGLVLVDRDYVEWSNLQRQQLYTEADARNQTPKAVAAKARLLEINSEVEIEAYVMDAAAASLTPLLQGIDLVIDATDNFDTRFMLNDLLQKNPIPWIFGSCVGSTGMSYTIFPNESPCLRCLLDAIPIHGATCDSAGIISPAVQMAAAHQTTEALKILTGDKAALRTSLLTFDLWNNHYHTMKVDRAKKGSCPSCGDNPSYPSLKFHSSTKSEVLCGRNTVQIRASQAPDLRLLKERLKRIGTVKANDFLISIEYETYRLVFFQDGRTLIHGTNSIEKAKSIYYQLAG